MGCANLHFWPYAFEEEWFSWVDRCPSAEVRLSLGQFGSNIGHEEGEGGGGGGGGGGGRGRGGKD